MMGEKKKPVYVGCSHDVIISAESFAVDALFPSNRYCIFPGFCDVHVHFREPGFSYKETILTGSKAAAAGGYTAVCTMPNLNPVPDSIEHLQLQLGKINQDSVIHAYPYGAITVGQMGETLSDMNHMAADVVAFSDDGRGVQDETMMRQAMLCAKSLGKIIVAHCEVNDLLHGGYIHDGDYAKEHGHKGICSESEYLQIQRDIRLAEETGCAYHVCHISTKESVELIRQAKSRGVDISCETAPHYLLLDDSMLCEDGSYKMNPPIRSKNDRDALLAGILDGTIDMLATDHAPHCQEEKSKGLSGSSFGIVGLETAFALLYTNLVETEIITLNRLIELFSTNPRKRFMIPEFGDFTVWDMSQAYSIEPQSFLSKGKSTPFAGWEVKGKCVMTVCNGKIVYRN